MNTERPDNDDAAREPKGVPGPEGGRGPEGELGPEDQGAASGIARGDDSVGEEVGVPGGEAGVPRPGPEESAAGPEESAAGPEEPAAGPESEVRKPTAALEPAAPGAVEPSSDGREPAATADSAVPDAAGPSSEGQEAEAGTVAPDEAGAASHGRVPEGNPSSTAPGSAGSASDGREPTAAPDPAASASAEARPAAAQASPDGAPEPVGEAEEEKNRAGVLGGSSGDGAGEGGRRRSSVLVASVAAAAVLIVGGGGAYLAAGAGGGADGDAGAASKGGTPPALVLDDYAPASAAESGNGIAPGEPNPYGVTYRADGTLPDGPGSASVYWAKGEVTRAEVARLADALGVEGTPVAEGRTWKVGSGKDGSGPVLRVESGAPGLWTFSRYAPGTDACKSGGDVCAPDTTASSADPVGEAAAKKAAAPVLKAVGQDDAKIDASRVMGARRIVNADPEIDGLPTYGWTTGVTVSAQGEVVEGNGQVKAPVEGETYPVLGARETLDRMNAAPGADHRMGIGGCATPVPAKDRLESPCEGSTGVPRKETLTVEDAVFGLAPHASGGRQALVPSWLFSVRGTGAGEDYTVTYPAVAPEFLSAPPAATPSEGASSSGTGTHDVQVDGYTAEGAELVVGFTGGVCSDYRATAVESGNQVKVTVTETPWPDAICIKVAKFFHRTVKLDEPLGDRTVVGTDGARVPLEKPGARLPR